MDKGGGKAERGYPDPTWGLTPGKDSSKMLRRKKLNKEADRQTGR